MLSPLTLVIVTREPIWASALFDDLRSRSELVWQGRHPGSFYMGTLERQADRCTIGNRHYSHQVAPRDVYTGVSVYR